ncbi:MAG: cupin domain-containing protein [Synergistales bacterium]|mgnify:CR=1 FL=1|jgi:quercetin dioxygenase-like cupin family protein|nr:cupin domain-containing protein [Synergistales bacterium]
MVMKLVDMNRLEKDQILPGLRARFVHSENMTVAYWNMDAGADFPLHDHTHEQVVNVVSGRVEVLVRGEKTVLDEGCVLVLAPGEPHSVHAVMDSFVIDVFHPIRQDYKRE